MKKAIFFSIFLFLLGLAMFKYNHHSESKVVREFLLTSSTQNLNQMITRSSSKVLSNGISKADLSKKLNKSDLYTSNQLMELKSRIGDGHQLFIYKFLILAGQNQITPSSLEEILAEFNQEALKHPESLIDSLRQVASYYEIETYENTELYSFIAKVKAPRNVAHEVMVEQLETFGKIEVGSDTTKTNEINPKYVAFKRIIKTYLEIDSSESSEKQKMSTIINLYKNQIDPTVKNMILNLYVEHNPREQSKLYIAASYTAKSEQIIKISESTN